MKNQQQIHDINNINVVIDIDLLGLGYVYPKARTGVFRVTEELLRSFLENQKLNVYFSSQNNLSDSIAFLESSDISGKGRFIHSKEEISVANSINRFRGVFTQVNFLIKVFRKIRYKYFHKTSGFSELPEKAVFFSPYYELPEEIKGNSEIKKVLLVHDLISFRLPELFEESNRNDVRKSIQSIDQYTTLVCVSKSTKKDLKEFFPKIKNSVRIIPLAANKRLFYRVENKAKIDFTLKKYGIPNRPYLLSLSTLEPRKNIETTIKAFNKLLKEHHEINASLVLVGTLGWNYNTIFNEILNSNTIKDKLIVTGFVEDSDLATLYSGATGFVYPSLYEGFGLPQLEAMQCGVPVVVSNTSSIPEVVGDAGIYIKPMDKIAIKDAMEILLTDRIYSKELSQKSIAQAANFSWRNSVAKYVKIFQELMAE